MDNGNGQGRGIEEYSIESTGRNYNAIHKVKGTGSMWMVDRWTDKRGTITVGGQQIKPAVCPCTQHHDTATSRIRRASLEEQWQREEDLIDEERQRAAKSGEEKGSRSGEERMMAKKNRT